MTDLSHLHDDEIVAEMQRRLDRGTVGWHGLLSTDQMHFRDMWSALMGTVHDARNRYPHEFGTKLVFDHHIRLANQGGPVTRPYAINTTFYGKDTAYQDHAPVVEAAE